jgi:hypothetical protein
LITLDLSTGVKVLWREITRSVLICQYFLDGQCLAVGLAESLFIALEVNRQIVTYALKQENRSCLDLCISKDNNHMVIFWGPEENEAGITKNGIVKIYSIDQNTIRLLHSINQQQDLFSPSSRIDFLCENKLVAIAGIDGNVTIIDLASGD